MAPMRRLANDAKGRDGELTMIGLMNGWQFAFGVCLRAAAMTPPAVNQYYGVVRGRASPRLAECVV